MPLSEDPTPCPLPRTGIRSPNHGRSLLCDNDPSVTLPARAPGLRDAKPRRPRASKRQSVVWDPTIDIYDDTFAFQQKKPQPHATSDAPAEHDRPVGVPNSQASKCRRSSLLAQPAQRKQWDPSNGISSALDVAGKRRRISSVQAPQRQPANTIQAQVPPKNEEAMNSQHLRQTRVISKEPRRRTIYVPSEDTTIMTIHPGRSWQEGAIGSSRPQTQQKSQPQPRKSDVFFDLATLGEEGANKSGSTHKQENQAPATRKMPRKSLALAPRRAPLQANLQPAQPTAASIDVPGQGDGKENVPPEAGLGGAKKLGKRANLIAPDRRIQMQDPKPGLHTISESPQAQPDDEQARAEREHVSQQPCQDPLEELKKEMHGPVPNEQPAPKPDIQTQPPPDRRQSIHIASSTSSAAARRPRHSMIPSSLSAPLLLLSQNSHLPKHPVLTEDIPNPSLYEESWLIHQEQAISQLINSLFESASTTAHPCKSSTQYFTFNPPKHALRKSLLDVYNAAEVPLLHKRLLASLRFGGLSIPVDTLTQVARIRDDFGQRQRFLDLWLKTYAIDALEAAAEVVVGRQVGTTSRSSSSPQKLRAKAMTNFLKTFLVGNQDMQAQRRSRVVSCGSPMAGSCGTSAESLRDSRSAAPIWRRTVLRSLMMIWVLDRAHATGNLEGKCLFHPTSPYKSSGAVVQGLCRLLLPSIGDAGRVLNHLGYTLTHVQYPLEEYDYHIANLATDLRDGIRLTRLVEVLLYPPSQLDLHHTSNVTFTLPDGITLTNSSPSSSHHNATARPNDCPLSTHLKHPTPSRTHKLHNASIALAALSNIPEAKSLLDDMRPDDIVDGHREKCVRLLWGLVGRWGLEALVDFNLVEREIRRLRAVWARRQGPRSAQDDDLTDHLELSQQPPGTLKHNALLLKLWARAAARLHDVPVPNLSTAFADGAVYRVLVHEYTPYLPLSISSEPSSPPSSSSFTQTLQALGCSRTFLSLFSSSSVSRASIRSSKTTLPLLAFLASRLLPLSEPCMAATRIQRMWRRRLERFESRRRVRALVLSHRCRGVVEARERMLWAVGVLERWWKVRCWE